MGDKQYRLGNDGELEQVKGAPKRKRGSEGNSPSNLPVLSLGALMVFILGVVGGLFLGRLTSTPVLQNVIMIVTATQVPTPVYTWTPNSTKTPLPTSTRAPTVILPTTTPQPTATAFVPPPPTSVPTVQVATPVSRLPTVQQGQLGFVIGISDGTILVSGDGKTFAPLGVKGHDVAASPDGKAIAYQGPEEGRIYIYRDGKQHALNSFGHHKLPAWGPNGKSLAYLANGADGKGNQGDFVYWLKITSSYETDTALYMGFEPSISAPPLTDPISGRLLIVTNVSVKISAFFTVDPICGCSGGLQSYVQVPNFVNWATYSPDGKQIIFSEDNGSLYTIDTKTLKVSPLVTDKTVKNRPVFSPDGKKLAYFDDHSTIIVMTLADKSFTKIPVSGINGNIESLDWLPPVSS